MDQLKRYIFHQTLETKIDETKIDESAWKKISYTKIQVCTSDKLHLSRPRFTYFIRFFFSQT